MLRVCSDAQGGVQPGWLEGGRGRDGRANGEVPADGIAVLGKVRPSLAGVGRERERGIGRGMCAAGVQIILVVSNLHPAACSFCSYIVHIFPAPSRCMFCTVCADHSVSSASCCECTQGTGVARRLRNTLTKSPRTATTTSTLLPCTEMAHLSIAAVCQTGKMLVFALSVQGSRAAAAVVYRNLQLLLPVQLVATHPVLHSSFGLWQLIWRF